MSKVGQTGWQKAINTVARTRHGASPLETRLYEQIKRVLNQDVAVIGPDGLARTEVNDFSTQKHFTLSPKPNLNVRTVSVKENKKQLGVPIFVEQQLYATIVLESSQEDLRSIEVISSLAELIIERFVAEHRPNPDALDLLFSRLAKRPDSVDLEEVDYQLTALGYSAHLERVAIAWQLEGFWHNYLQWAGGSVAGDKSDIIAAKKRDIARALNSFFTKHQDNLIGYIGHDTFLVLKEVETGGAAKFADLFSQEFNKINHGLRNVHIKNIRAGLGRPGKGLTELISSVNQALRVLDIGQKVIGHSGVYRYEDLGALPILLSGPQEPKTSFASSLLSKLKDEELRQTLISFLDNNLNLTETATALSVHRNTVIYRLNKLTQALGKDPRKFEAAVELHLALLFSRYYFDSETKD